MKLFVVVLALLGTALAMPLGEKEEAQPNVPLVIADYSSVSEAKDVLLKDTPAQSSEEKNVSTQSSEEQAPKEEQVEKKEQPAQDAQPQPQPEVKELKVDAPVLEAKPEEKLIELPKEEMKEEKKEEGKELKDEKLEDSKETAASESKAIAIETPADLKPVESVASVDPVADAPAQPIEVKEETPVLKDIPEKKIDIEPKPVEDAPAPAADVVVLSEKVDAVVVKPEEKSLEPATPIEEVKPVDEPKVELKKSENQESAAAEPVQKENKIEKIAEGKSEDLSKIDEKKETLVADKPAENKDEPKQEEPKQEEKKSEESSEQPASTEKKDESKLAADDQTRVVRETEQSEEASSQQQSKEQEKSEPQPEKKQEKTEKDLSLDSSSQESGEQKQDKPQEDSKEENKSAESESAEKEQKAEATPAEPAKQEEKSEEKKADSSNESSSDSS